MAALSFATGALLGGLASARIKPPSALVQQRLGPQVPHQKKLWISALCHSMTESGHNLHNVDAATTLYNNNEVCVKWSQDLTTKGTRHIELRENLI